MSENIREELMMEEHSGVRRLRMLGYEHLADTPIPFFDESNNLLTGKEFFQVCHQAEPFFQNLEAMDESHPDRAVGIKAGRVMVQKYLGLPSDI